MNQITRTVVASVLTAAFVGPVTWGFSQQIIADRFNTSLTSVSERVVVVEKKMERHDLLIVENKASIERADRLYETRINNVIKLWEQQEATARELIQVVRTQNEINSKLIERLNAK